jgi:hypothetical protein
MHLFKIALVLCVVLVPWLLRRWKVEERLAWTPPFGLRALGIVALVAILCVCAGPSKVDDAYIYARYVANAVAGRGMVFNLGEHVNALTSPLFAYLLLLGSWMLHGKVLLATEILSGGFMLLACLLAEGMVAFAGLFLASTAYFYALVGMETTLFAFMLLAVAFLFVTKRYGWLPLACVLLVLTRFEGGLLVALVAWQLVRLRARIRWTAFLPALVVGCIYLGLNHHYYGVYLPSSATAKLGQGFSGFWGPWPKAFLWHTELLQNLFAKTVYLIPLLLGFVTASLVMRSNRAYDGIVLPFCGILLAFYVGMNLTGFYFWYFAPFILFGIFYAASAIPRTRVAAVAASALVVVLAVTNGRFLRLPRPEVRYVGYIEAGQWLRQNTPADARIGTVEIGLLGWYSDRYLIDVIGLVTPANAAHIAHHDGSSWLTEDRPDYILLHTADWPWEVVAKQSSEYVMEPVQFDGGVYLVRRRDYGGWR